MDNIEIKVTSKFPGVILPQVKEWTEEQKAESFQNPVEPSSQPGQVIAVIGLPGSGKTTFAKMLAVQMEGAVHFNADVVRATVNKDLGFSHEDRLKHASRLGEISRLVADGGHNVVVDFVCPTRQTRAAFSGENTILWIWMNTIPSGRFEDTNKMFEPPFCVPEEAFMFGKGKLLVFHGYMTRFEMGFNAVSIKNKYFEYQGTKLRMRQEVPDILICPSPLEQHH